MRLAAVTMLALTTLFMGPLSQDTYASQRYGYRSYGYRSSAYRYRPGYRAPSYRYRPYYRPYYRTYYRPYYRSYWRPYAYGYWPSFYWPSFYYSWAYRAPYVQYSYYGGGAVDYSYQHGSVRTHVEPKQTEIYVDGYYAGIADDFDGMFQRLYVPPGQHEIQFRLEGYRTHRQSLHVNSGTTYKLHHEMEALGPGETTPPPPEPPKEQRYYEERKKAAPDRDRRDVPPPREDVLREEQPTTPPRPSEEQAPSEPPRYRAPGRFGLLSLRVQPADAEVFIGGELWGTLEGLEGLVIHLPAGRHSIEIRKNGFQPFATEVDIQQGETTPLNVKLDGMKLDV